MRALTPAFVMLLVVEVGCHGTPPNHASAGDEPLRHPTTELVEPKRTPREPAGNHPFHIGIPDSIDTVGWFAGDQSPLLTVSRKAKQPCIDEVADELTGIYQLTPSGGPPFHVALGNLDRDAIESCVVAVLGAFDAAIEVRRHGNVTELRSGNAAQYAVFGDGRVVWHHNRAEAEAMWKAVGLEHVAHDVAAVSELLPAPPPAIFFVSVRDFIGVLTGVPSAGAVVILSETAAVTVIARFADPATARRAVAAIEAKELEASVPPAVRSMVAALDLEASGPVLTVRASKAAIAAPGLIQELEALVAPLAE
jgi:hypothetical protein